MTSHVHELRRAVRRRLAAGQRVLGTFVKLASPDVVETAADAGFDVVVVDLEHSTLTPADAVSLVRHADVCGLAALVRVPTVEPALINRLLENGAAGIQLSMLRTAWQNRDLVSATRFAPQGSRSVSTANRVADGLELRELLAREQADPPLLVGQIETAVSAPLTDVLAGLDVCFVGPTDLAVDLRLEPWTEAGRSALGAAVAELRHEATECGVAFGGWAASADAPSVDGGQYRIVGSDLQLLTTALRGAAGTGL